MGFDFFIIGAQKAASTSLQRALSAASGVHLLPGEIGLFEEPDWGETVARQRLAAWRKDANGRLLGGKRPNLLGEERALQRLIKTSPGVMLLVVLRDPVKRAFSALVHFYRYGSLEVDDPSAVLLKLVDGSSHAPEPLRSILAYGRYGEHLHRIVRKHPGNGLLVVTEKTLQTAPGEVTRRIGDFLGVAVPPLISNERRNVGANNLTRVRYFRSITRMCFHVDRGTGRIHPRAPARVFGGLHRVLALVDKRMLAPVCRSTEFTLTAEAAEALRDYYQADQEKLAELQWKPGVEWC